MKKTLLLLCLLFPLWALSQGEQPVLSGKVRSITRNDHAVTIRTTNAYAEILCYSPTVLQVRLSRTAPAENFSYAVIQKPTVNFTGLRDDGASVTLTTDSLQVTIHKDPFRIVFMNREGKVLSEDYEAMPFTWLGTEVTCSKRLFPDEKFVGLGEKAGPLNKRGNSYKNWNSDVPAYATNHDPLYQSIPFFMGIHNQVTYGIFLDNSYLTKFNFGASTDEQFSSFSAANGEMNYYFFGAKGLAGILRDYTWLTGRMPMPPLWSLGYQQCRWSYYPESEVIGLARKFREKNIPCDVIYLDIDYMDAYKIFTWNKDRFPRPKTMTDQLNDLGFHLAVIVDPGIKVEKGYFAYDEGVVNNFFVKYPDGRNYIGNVWPGRCHFPDFTSEPVRKWWGNSFSRLVDAGVEGFWNDMNEPSAWGQSIPDVLQFSFEGRNATMARAHNLYGLEMSRATFEGTRGLLKGRRPFVLTRAGYAGIQRFSAVWTGDNEATDDHMLLSARMTTGMGLSGVSFVGPDLGGFIGNPSKELYLRWLSLGVYTPFFRNHSAWDTKSKEPWSFGLDIENLSRELISQRYKLLPYIYSAFYESTQSGMPVARSLAISFPFDEKVYWEKYQNEYLFGDNLLVCPVSCTQNAAKVYLPVGHWYRLGCDASFEGGSEITVDAPLDDLPVFVRAGAIIPMQSVVQFTDQKPDSRLEVHVYSGKSGSTFRYYEDDGVTYDFENGSSYKRDFIYDPAAKTITLNPAEGSFVTKFTGIRLILHDFDEPMSVKLNGSDHMMKMRSVHEKVVDLPLNNDKMVIRY